MLRQINQTLRSSRAAVDLATIIVGVVVIGIIGAVSAATIFALVPWMQDRSAKQRLSSVSIAENSYKGAYDTYGYDLSDILDIKTLAVDKIRIQSDNKTCYAAFSKSSTGNYFYNTSSTTDPQTLGKTWPTTKPANYPAGCTWPSSWDASIVHSTGNLNLATDPVKMTGWSDSVNLLTSTSSGVPSGSPLSGVIKVNGTDNLPAGDLSSYPSSDTSTTWKVSGWVATDIDSADFNFGAWFGPYSGPPGGGLVRAPFTVKKADGWTYFESTVGINTIKDNPKNYAWYDATQLNKSWNWRPYVGTNSAGQGHLYVTGFQVSKVG